MRLSVNYECKVFQVWCTKEERNVENFFAIVDGMAKKYNIPSDYKYVIYTSGEGDFVALTSDLLRYNRDIL